MLVIYYFLSIGKQTTLSLDKSKKCPQANTQSCETVITKVVAGLADLTEIGH